MQPTNEPPSWQCRKRPCLVSSWLGLAAGIGLAWSGELRAAAVFNVRDYGATGQKADDARLAIQKAIDACGAAGGGVVTLPAGQYTSGTLHLRSHVRVRLEAGATLFASTDAKAYDFEATDSRAALLFGENLLDVCLEGRGTVDGQAEYEWLPDDIERGFDHKTWMQAAGKSLLRSVPRGFPQREVFPKLLWLGHSKNVRVNGLNLLHSPSWTLTLFGCEHAAFEDLYIYTSLKEAVWADGIDLDGCKEVLISNCTIETGDDCVAFSSQNGWGPAQMCENVCVTNCRLSSASAGIKFSEGNRVGIRDIRVCDTLFNNVNRGIAFNSAMGGGISNVVLSDLTINCNRCDWFWAGDGQPFRFRLARWSELNQEPPKPGEAPPGTIRNITIRNVLARAKGSSLLYGHAESRLEGITLENVRLSMSTDPTAPYDKAQHALDFRYIRELKLKNVEVRWETPSLEGWKSALNFADVKGLRLEGFAGREAWPGSGVPAVMLSQVSDALVRKCRALAGTGVFLGIAGASSQDIRLEDNELGKAKLACRVDKEVAAGVVQGVEPTPAK